MGWMIDLLLIALFLIPLWISWKRGFVRSIIGFASLLIALLITCLYTSALGQCYDAWFVRRHVAKQVSGTLEKLARDSAGALNFDQLFENPPETLVKLTNRFGVSIDDLQERYRSAVVDRADNLADQLADFLTANASETISAILAAITLFFGSRLILWLLSLMLSLLVELPILKQLDSLLGLLLGGLSGLILVIVVSGLLFRLLPALAAAYPDTFGKWDLNDSSILCFFAEWTT